MSLESADYQERLSKATTGLAGRIAETNKKVCPIDAVALVNGRCNVCGRQVNPSGPDTSGLSEQEARNVAFWSKRLQTTTSAATRAKALSEIRKIDPDWKPDEVQPSLTERVGKFFTDVEVISPDGQKITEKRLREMG